MVVHAIEKHPADEFLKIILTYLCPFYPSLAGVIEQTELVPSSSYHANFILCEFSFVTFWKPGIVFNKP